MTFIECWFFLPSEHYCWSSRASKRNLNSVIQLAGRLGDCKFDDTDAVCYQCMKLRCLRMFNIESNSSLFQLNHLPSGCYRRLEVAICSNCYRAKVIRYMNNLWYKFHLSFYNYNFVFLVFGFYHCLATFFCSTRNNISLLQDGNKSYLTLQMMAYSDSWKNNRSFWLWWRAPS